MEKFNGKASLIKKINNDIAWLTRYRSDEKMKMLFYNERMREFQKIRGESAAQKTLPI